MNFDPLLIGSISVFALSAGLSFFETRFAGLRKFVSGLLLLGLALLTVLIVQRWDAMGRAPFKTLHESLVLFSWCVTVGLLVARRVTRLPQISYLGAGVPALALLYAIVNADLEAVHLPPALQSPWFIPHVVTYFAAYGTLIIGSLAAAIYLFQPRHASGQNSQSQAYLAVTHRFILVGFPLLTLGMVLGAVWAKTAWGDYWAWDPKENAALITWLLYGAYFHVRRLPEWSERSHAWLALAGGVAILFTYLAMNVLPTAEASSHVYQ